MKTKIIISGIILVSVFGFASPALAQEGTGGGFGKKEQNDPQPAPEEEEVLPAEEEPTENVPSPGTIPERTNNVPRENGSIIEGRVLHTNTTDSSSRIITPYDNQSRKASAAGTTKPGTTTKRKEPTRKYNNLFYYFFRYKQDDADK